MKKAEISYFNLSYDDISAVSEMELRMFAQPWTESSIGHYMDSGNMIFIVAKHLIPGKEPKLAGYMALLRTLDEADLVSIAVDEDYRNMGIARELLDIGYDMALEAGVRLIHLEVRKSNEAAICLYESEGFRKDGIRKNFYKAPIEDALLYTKEL